ncbi:MAG: EamA family transporter [Candidatus Micrarchaeota archaeon]|nr:EamA family transporter [Candidatus Micrarchaeota archaeon]
MLQWYYLAILAAIFTAASTLIEKYALKEEHATQYSASLSVIGAIVPLVFIPFATLANINLTTVVIIYLSSFFGSWAYLVQARLYKHSNISMSTPTVNTLPNIFIVIIAFFFLGEKLQLFQYASIVVLIAATYLMFLNGKKSLWGKAKTGFIPMLINSSITSAIAWALVKYILNINVNPFTFLIISQLFMGVNMVVFIQLRYHGLGEIKKMVAQYPMAILSSTIATVLYRILFYLALLGAQVSIAMPLRTSVFIVLTVLLGSIFFKEDNLVKRILLSLIMIAASYVLIL